MTGDAPELAALSVADLAAAGRDVPARFVVRLVIEPQAGTRAPLAAGTAVRCEEILRLLPGRRLVARVRTGGGRRAVMKLFLGAGARRYCRREWRGCAIMARAGTATPHFLGRVRAPADDPGTGFGLLFDYVSDARPLDPGDGRPFEAAAAALGRLHEGGALHRDLHVDNFLCTSGGVLLVDGDGVRPAWFRRVSRRTGLAGLARLCAERPPSADADLERVYERYAGARGWTGEAAARRGGASALKRLTRAQRRIRVRRYLAKAQRECTEYHCRRSLRRYFVCVREQLDDGLRRFAADPESVMAQGRVLKAGNSATVVRARIGGRPLIVKRYNHKSFRQALRRALRPLPRYRRAWINGQGLRLLEIPTARPLALVECRAGPFRGRAYLVMEDLGDLDLATEVRDSGLSPARLAQVVALFETLATAGLVHGDTKASNFLIADDRVHLVDLDALSCRGSPAEDRRRFLANFSDDVRARVEAAFTAVGLEAPGGGTSGFAPPPRRL